MILFSIEMKLPAYSLGVKCYFRIGSSVTPDAPEMQYDGYPAAHGSYSPKPGYSLTLVGRAGAW